MVILDLGMSVSLFARIAKTSTRMFFLSFLSPRANSPWTISASI
jgi:hypothetical protein